MRGHAWLVDAIGNVVDPTRDQFPGPIEYEEWKPGDVVRVGKCMNCGEEIWEPVESLGETPPQKSVCSLKCNDELMESFK